VPSFAKYWKNGTEVDLTSGTTVARTFGIYELNGTVYTGGSEYDAAASTYWSGYWSNVIPVKFSPTFDITAMSIQPPQ
jgi:hypothetical protein